MSLLNIEDLRVSFAGEKERIPVLRGVDLKVEKGEVVGLAGESGCGKSLTALSILKLLPEGANFDKGQIFFEDHNILEMRSEALQEIRGKRIAMIFQEPGVSLNPLFTIGNQIGEAVERQFKATKSLRAIAKQSHEIATSSAPKSGLLAMTPKLKVQKSKIMEETERLLELVRIPRPKAILHQYPHQLSGGMAQRAMIAMALAQGPSLLIADEPTTSLDVTTEAQIIALLKELKSNLNMSILFISHNLALISNLAKRIAIMYLGRIVEVGPMDRIINEPVHPYTRALLLCLPELKKKGKALSSIPGSVPEPSASLSGCAFAPRCQERKEICRREAPKIREVGEGHFVACYKIRCHCEER